MNADTPKPSRSRDDLRLLGPDLRWQCDPGWLSFRTTADVEPITGVVGQDDAVEALRFGLEIDAPGQNIFVRGLSGTGRMSLVRHLMQEIQPACALADDRLYVHNFVHPDRPRLLTLPRGQGRPFEERIDRLIEFIEEELVPGLASEKVKTRRSGLEERLQAELRRIGKPFEEELEANGLALVPIQIGQSMQPIIMPLVEGQPAPPERYQQLRQEGKISDADAEAISRKIETFGKRFQELGEKIGEIQNQHRDEVTRLFEKEAREIITREVKRVEMKFPFEPVREFLDQVVEDLVRHRLKTIQKDLSFTRLYRVNLVLAHQEDEPCPFIIENTPSLQNLLGNIEREFRGGGPGRSDHLMIKAGTLLRADGGYLILEAMDLLAEPGAWKTLVRTLRTGKLEIAPTELSLFAAGPHPKPEPIDVRVKVVLLGGPALYYLLDANDPDFAHLFKVLVDFDTTVPRDEKSVRHYARVLAKLVREEGLPDFSSEAVGAVCEHGARVAARRDRLTAKFGRLADIAREAAHLTRKRGDVVVSDEDVREAVRRTRRRADLPARQFRKLVADGTIRIQTTGDEVGQVNGLAVIHAGPLTYGFPTRITATVGPGTAGAIDIEREADLSGSIHTKGFYILGGLLRHLLKTQHSLAFSASVAFEQSYGGIDGDSASGAEVCCLLSALTGVPLRQDLAMTGAIDQLGHLQPIGAVTEKIEGFFDICNDLGLTGTQGVIIPRANAGDVMVRGEVAQACRDGRFHVYAAGTVGEALEVFTGWETGEIDEEGDYPEGSLLQLAKQKVWEYWRMAAAVPELPEEEADEEEAEEGSEV